MKRLEGKTVLITGGAQGIGRAGAELFTREGAHVVIADINEKLGNETALTLGATFVKCDVSKTEDVRAVIEKCPALDARRGPNQQRLVSGSDRFSRHQSVCRRHSQTPRTVSG